MSLTLKPSLRPRRVVAGQSLGGAGGGTGKSAILWTRVPGHFCCHKLLARPPSSGVRTWGHPAHLHILKTATESSGLSPLKENNTKYLIARRTHYRKHHEKCSLRLTAMNTIHENTPRNPPWAPGCSPHLGRQSPSFPCGFVPQVRTPHAAVQRQPSLY